MEWIIDEKALRHAAETSRGQESKYFKTLIPDVEYYLQINPNGDTRRGEVWTFLYFENSTKKIQANWTVSIKSASWEKHLHYIYDFQSTNGYGTKVCSLEDLFNPDKNFFVDGKMKIKLECNLKVLDLKRKATSEVSTLAELLSEREDKDFVIAVGEDEVKVTVISLFKFI